MDARYSVFVFNTDGSSTLVVATNSRNDATRSAQAAITGFDLEYSPAPEAVLYDEHTQRHERWYVVGSGAITSEVTY